MFLLVPAHPGCPGQNAWSHKIVVRVCVDYGMVRSCLNFGRVAVNNSDTVHSAECSLVDIMLSS